MSPTTERIMQYAVLAVLAILAVLCFSCVANGQTSTIGALPDTIYSLEVTIPVFVDPPNGDLVGVYWRINGETGWMYAGAGTESITWTAPMDNAEYQFYSQVDPEPYREIPSASVYICSTCETGDCPDCPPPSLLTSVQVVAEFDPSAVSVEVLTLEWYWTHATTGEEAVSYTMFYEVLTQAGDTLRAEFPGLTRMDSLYGYADTPYPTGGEKVRASVAGVDSLGRMGPKAVYSAPWFGDDGPPGEPGQASKRTVNR